MRTRPGLSVRLGSEQVQAKVLVLDWYHYQTIPLPANVTHVTQCD